MWYDLRMDDVDVGSIVEACTPHAVTLHLYPSFRKGKRPRSRVLPDEFGDDHGVVIASIRTSWGDRGLSAQACLVLRHDELVWTFKSVLRSI